MTAVQEQFMQILPQMQRDIRIMPDSDVQQIINIYVNWKPKQEQQTKKKHKAVKDSRRRRGMGKGGRREVQKEDGGSE